MGVREHSEHGRRVIPMLPAAGLGHHEELAEGEGAGIDSDDSGEFVHEPINPLAARSTSRVASRVSR